MIWDSTVYSFGHRTHRTLHCHVMLGEPDGVKKGRMVHRPRVCPPRPPARGCIALVHGTCASPARARAALLVVLLLVACAVALGGGEAVNIFPAAGCDDTWGRGCRVGDAGAREYGYSGWWVDCVLVEAGCRGAAGAAYKFFRSVAARWPTRVALDDATCVLKQCIKLCETQ